MSFEYRGRAMRTAAFAAMMAVVGAPVLADEIFYVSGAETVFQFRGKSKKLNVLSNGRCANASFTTHALHVAKFVEKCFKCTRFVAGIHVGTMHIFY